MSASAHAGDFDRSALERLVRFGGMKLLAGMVDIFEESAPPRMRAFEEALAGEDVEVLRRTFHSLKSSAAQLGAMRLSESCRAGEALLAGGAAPAASGALVERVRLELDEAIDWMRDARRELEGHDA